MNQVEKQAAPEYMRDRCPLCTMRVGEDLGKKLVHLTLEHKRASVEAEELIARLNP